MVDDQVQEKPIKKKPEKKHECPLCSKMFSTQYLLEQHLMIVHDGERPHKCSLCDRGYSSAGGLRHHMRTHTGEKPYKCSVCNKAFSTSGNLSVHMRIHTREKPYKCPICHKSFRQKSWEHMMIHTGEKRYKCSQCGKAFPTRARLNRHVKSHTGEKPHECSICTRRFAQKGHLKGHMKTHLPLEPLPGYTNKCPLCSRAFASYKDLNQHMSCHLGIPKHSTTDGNVSGEGDQISYACSFCDKQFDTMTTAGMQDAFNHLDTHREEKVKSGVSSQLNSEATLQKDKKVVTSGIGAHEDNGTECDGQILYTCCFCDKQFDTTSPEGMVEACDHLDTHNEKKVEASASEKQEPEKLPDKSTTDTAVSNTDNERKPTQGSTEDNVKRTVPIPQARTGVPVSVLINNKKLTRPVYLNHNKISKFSFICPVCQRQFTQASYLKAHILTHKVYLDEHFSDSEEGTLTHVEGKDHKCTHCEREFPTESALEEHEMTHIDHIQYACSVCSKQFDTMLDVCNHMQSHNEEILAPISTLQQKIKVEDEENKTMATNIAVSSEDEKGNVIQSPMSHISQSRRPAPLSTIATDADISTCVDNIVNEIPRTTCMENESQKDTVSLKLDIGARGLLPNTKTDKDKEIIMAMNKHIKSEQDWCTTSQRPNIYHECSICNKKFLNALYLQKHIALKHKGPRSENSPQCKANDGPSSGLMLHEVAPTKGKSWKSILPLRQSSTDLIVQKSSSLTQNCPITDKSDMGSCKPTPEKDPAFESNKDNQGTVLKQGGGFVRPYNMLCEAKSVGKPYKCSECSAQFVDPLNFVSHLVTHGGLKVNRCPVCFLRFKNVTNLKRHIRRDHAEDKRDISDSVVQVEKQESKMSFDMTIDTAQVEERCHLCVFCGKEFKSKLAADKHMTDTAGSCKKGDLVRKCVLCGEQFTSLIDLKVHMTTHSGDKVYKCSLCKLAFIAKIEYEKHMETHKQTIKKAQTAEGQSHIGRGDAISFLDFCRNNPRDIPHVCVLCGVEFDTWEAVTKHVHVHDATNS